MKYYDQFSDPGYHSAFFTSFTFNGDTFENIVLNRLRGAKCHNTHVVSDFHMFKQELDLYGPPSQAGLRYHFALHKRPNAFHPKIVLQLGREKARLLVGSANLTVTGLAGNKELVDEIICEGPDDPIQPIFAYAARYIQSCFPAGDIWFKQGFRRALELSPWFSLTNAVDRVEKSETDVWGIVQSEKKITAVAQFAEFIGNDEISRLNVVSPFWDQELAALGVMSKRFKGPEIRVGIETGRGLFPVDNLKKIGNAFLYSVDEFSASRNIHAKVIIAEGNKYDHVLSGSLNCSAAAFLSTRDNPINAEFGLYRRIKKGHALNQLGLLESFKHKVDLSTIEPFRRPKESIDKNSNAINAQISLNRNLVSIVLEDSRQRLPSAVQLSSTVAATNWPSIALSLDQSGQTWVATTAIEQQSANIAIIVFSDGTRSEPLIVCNIANLNTNSSSSHSRKIENLLQKLNEFSFEDLDIIDILLELQEVQIGKSKGLRPRTVSQKTNTRGQDDNEKSVVPFDEFIELDSVSVSEASQNFMGVDHRYSHETTDVLNRLLGLITTASVTFNDGDVDLNPTDPRDNDDDSPERPLPTLPIKRQFPEKDIPATVDHKIKAYRYNTADCLVEAVDGFCLKFSEDPDHRIDVTDLTHARALVQIILSNARPLIVEGNRTLNPVLPIFDKVHKRTGWPRLVGKVLQSVDRELKNIRSDCDELDIEIGDNRTIDCLAVLLGSGTLAVKACKTKTQLQGIIPSIERMIQSIGVFQTVLFKNSQSSSLRFSEIQNVLNSKFDDSLF